MTLRRISAVSVASTLLVGAIASPARAETPVGGIYVTTLPASADIWVDGTYVGHSPVLIDGLTPGRHAVTITKTGWSVRETDVSVDAGSIAMESERLEASSRAQAGDRGTGSLVVRSVPPGAALEIDGAPLAAPPGQPLSLPAGPHRLTITVAHARASRTIEIVAQTTTAIVLAPGPAPASDGEAIQPARSAVVAPADQYLPATAVRVEGDRVVVRYAGHVVIARLGEPRVRFDEATVVYAGAAEQIDGRLYLPLDLLEKLSGPAAK